MDESSFHIIDEERAIVSDFVKKKHFKHLSKGENKTKMCNHQLFQIMTSMEGSLKLCILLLVKLIEELLYKGLGDRFIICLKFTYFNNNQTNI